MESYADELFGLTRSGVLPEQEAHMADLKREMLGMPTAYVHVRHFPLIAFSIGKTGRRSIKEGYTPQFQPALTEDTVKNLKERVAALHTSVAVVSKPNGHLLCVWVGKGHLRRQSSHYRIHDSPKRPRRCKKVACNASSSKLEGGTR